MEKAIAVCGDICSGKSSIIEYLSKKYNWDIISFGNYIRHLALNKDLPASREIYQTLGQEIYERKGAFLFTQDVIQFNQPKSIVHLFDGVRHVQILKVLKQIYNETYSIYLKISPLKRFHRFKKRSLSEDIPLSFKEFKKISELPVEIGISEIESVADFVIDSSPPFQRVIFNIKAILFKKNFIYYF